MAKDTYYFSHDYNARTDAKIKKLLMKYKAEGYGIFWMIIEDLYNNANALQTDYDSIAFDLRVDKKIIESIINDFDLFIIKDGFFGSKSIETRLDQRAEKSNKARESAYARWNKDANALQTQSDSNAIKERKGKEIKVKEIDIYPTFNDFWDLYDKKTSKAKTELKWNKLKQKDKELIIDYLPNYINAKPDKQFRKDPITFLNNESWNDELIINNKNQKDEKRQFISKFAEAIKNGQSGSASLINEINCGNG